MYSSQPLLTGYPAISKQQLLSGHSTALALQHTLGLSPQPWPTATTLNSVLTMRVCVCFTSEDVEGAYLKYKSLRQYDRRTLGLTFCTHRSASYLLVGVSNLRALGGIVTAVKLQFSKQCSKSLEELYSDDSKRMNTLPSMRKTHLV